MVAGPLGAEGLEREAWSLLVISTMINQCVHGKALMQKNRTKQNSLCKGPEEGKPTWVCCNDWWNLASTPDAE